MKILFVRALEDSGLVTKWMSGMSPDKRSRIERMRRKNDILTAVTAHRLLCFALKSTFGIEPLPDDWAAGEYGKPYLKNLSGIHFNISHSGNMAMCALHDRQVGADIELIKPFSQGLERRIMSESEKQVFRQSDNKTKLFYQVWTLKESYLKYTGRGLGALGEITVLPGEDGIKSNIPGCRFASIDSIPGYQSAVCAETVESSAGFSETGGFLWGDGVFKSNETFWGEHVEFVGTSALNNF